MSKGERTDDHPNRKVGLEDVLKSTMSPEMIQKLASKTAGAIPSPSAPHFWDHILQTGLIDPVQAQARAWNSRNTDWAPPHGIPRPDLTGIEVKDDD